MMTVIAPNLTRNTLAADRVITAGSIIVFGWSLTSASATQRTVTFEDKDGNVYQDVVIAPGSTAGVYIDSSIAFLAANGLTVDIDTADADVKFTVFHSAIAGSA